MGEGRGGPLTRTEAALENLADSLGEIELQRARGLEAIAQDLGLSDVGKAQRTAEREDQVREHRTKLIDSALSEVEAVLAKREAQLVNHLTPGKPARVPSEAERATRWAAATGLLAGLGDVDMGRVTRNAVLAGSEFGPEAVQLAAFRMGDPLQVKLLLTHLRDSQRGQVRAAFSKLSTSEQDSAVEIAMLRRQRERVRSLSEFLRVHPDGADVVRDRLRRGE
jgi:hypothetical protein